MMIYFHKILHLARIYTLEDAYATTKRDVGDLKESLNANETDKKTTAERIQKLEDSTK